MLTLNTIESSSVITTVNSASAEAVIPSITSTASSSSSSSSSSASSSPPLNAKRPKYSGILSVCSRCGATGHRTTRCISHLIPQLIIATVASKKNRLEQICRKWRCEYDDAVEKRKSMELATNDASSSSSSIDSSSSNVDITKLSGYSIEQNYHLGTGLEVLPSEKG